MRGPEAIHLTFVLAALGCSLALGFQSYSRGLQPCRLLPSARICDARRRRLGSILYSAGGQGEEPSSLLPWERERLDDEPDSVFYQPPRLVYHADASQLARLNSAFRELISPGSDVLDLMSSWASHFDGLSLNKVSGLGMNEEELRCNSVLDDYVVHDLNLDPSIPHPDSSFDAVTISFGFQYLVHPEDVMREVGRVLRPGGRVFVCFSEDCYETKATRGWLARDSSGRVMLIRQVLSAAGFSGTRFHEGSLKAEWESSTASTSPSDDEYRFRDQGLLFFVSSTVGKNASSPVDAVAGGEEVGNRGGDGEAVEEGNVDGGVFMVNLEPSSPIVWQERFYSLVQEAAGLGIPPGALEKYNPAVGGGEPTPDQWREGMASVQNVIASRLSSNL